MKTFKQKLFSYCNSNFDIRKYKFIVRMEEINIHQKPCNVKYLPEKNRFLVGTYELADETDDCRLGSLIILNLDAKIEKVYQCSNGGVFDMRVVYDDDKYRVAVAHANGKISHYELSIIDNINTIVLVNTITILGSKILTCLDFLEESNSSLIVGDSDGCISTTNFDQKESIRQKITREDAIWYIKVFCLNKRKLIVIAAEDSSWYIFESVGGALKQIYRNDRDFTAGVTCIVDMRNDEERKNDSSLTIALGSYDETIKHYLIKFNPDANKLMVELTRQIKIANGGIWRARRITKPNKTYILVSAMYAGTKLYSPAEDRIQDIVNATDDSFHYDADVSIQNIVCIADYNRRKCLFFEKMDSLIEQINNK